MIERVKAKIERLDYFGKGIAHINDMVIFVKDGLPMEEAYVNITSKKKNYAQAEVDELITRSLNRVDNLCMWSNKCGGCDLIHLNYEEQLNYKEDKIRELFSRSFQYPILVNNIIATSYLNYRNKITLHVKNKKLGFYEEKSNSVIEINECLIANKYINAVIPMLSRIVSNNSLNEIVIKSNLDGDILLSLFGSIGKKEVLKELKGIKSIYLNNKLISGVPYIEEKINDLVFHISNKSFFQVNTVGANLLYNEVIRHVKDLKCNSILDLYCGTGTISALVSKYAKRVIGVEVEKDAYKDAISSVKLNNISNVLFINDKVENCINKFTDIDLVIVDPPRDGLVKEAIDNILRIKPSKIIYVSCDPITLIRDLKLLSDKYTINEVTPVDMFSNTHHVETVTLLSVKNI